MKKALYAVMAAPVLLTGATFAWVWSGERQLTQSMNVALPPIGPAPQSQDAQVLKGHEVFNTKGCVYCHGPNGAGGVKNNNSQGGEIPSLTKVSEGYSQEELKAKILGGVKEIGKQDAAGPAPPLYMPVWKGHITDSELDAVVAFLMSLAPKTEGGSDEF